MRCFPAAHHLLSPQSDSIDTTATPRPDSCLGSYHTWSVHALVDKASAPSGRWTLRMEDLAFCPITSAEDLGGQQCDAAEPVGSWSGGLGADVWLDETTPPRFRTPTPS